MPNPESPLPTALSRRQVLSTALVGGIALEGASAWGQGVPQGKEVRVGSAAELQRAVASAQPGSRILIAPGEYPGLQFRGLQGTEGSPVVLAGADPARPPRFTSGLHFARAAHLELRDFEIAGSRFNGLNIDDGGDARTPAKGITLRRIAIRLSGLEGNRDGIKLSGLDDFLVEGCTVEGWGSSGSAIDMVGCRNGRVEGCRFQGRVTDIGSNGVQAKGGAERITIRRNRFLECGGRGVNLGGNTGLPYFRPRPAGFEARDLRVEHNLFVGSMAAVVFAGVDRAVVSRNTIWMPSRWAFRILQENRSPEFVPCRGGVVEENIVVFRSDRWSEGGVNVAPGTSSETFRFTGNAWFCHDRPDRSAPRLPVPETNGMVGRDPQLVAPETGNYTVRPGSPAQGKGADLSGR